MPTTLGHSLAGYAIHVALSPGQSRPAGALVAWHLVVANAPDLDIVPGLLTGQPGLYHHGISHSVGLGVAAAVVVGPPLAWRYRRGFAREFLTVLALYCGHLLLDFLGRDPTPPLGLQLLWPLSQVYYLSPLPVFFEVEWPALLLPPAEALDYWWSFARALTVEILLLAPIVLWLRWAHGRRRGVNQSSTVA